MAEQEKKVLNKTIGWNLELKDVSGSKEIMLDDVPVIIGWNSKMEINACIGVPDGTLQKMDRVEHGCAGMYPRVLLGGTKYTLGSHFYDETEKKARNDYYSNHRGTGGSSSSSVKVDEINKQLDEFEAWTKEALKDNEELMNQFLDRIKMLRPEDKKITAAKNLVAGMTPAQLAALKAMLGC